MFSVKRNEQGPIIVPDPNIPWKAHAAFNCCPISVGKEDYLLYRAMNKPKGFAGGSFSLSVVGKARQLADGSYGEDEPFITPLEPWERFGCEDPRVTKVGGRYYIFYTALSSFPFGPDGIKAAVAISDDMETIAERHLVTPFNAKACCLFPEKIKGKFTMIMTSDTDSAHSRISIASFDEEAHMWDHTKMERVYGNIDKNRLNIPRGDQDHTEIGAPPVKTPYGWLLIYSNIKNFFGGSPTGPIFAIEAALLDLEDPRIVLGKTRTALMVPQKHYEHDGIVPNIVFPSGATLHGDILQIYYGGADTVGCKATTHLYALLSNMEFFVEPTRLLKQKIEDYRRSDLLSRPVDQPILQPRPGEAYKWEAGGVLNPTVIHAAGKFHMLYRAFGDDKTSTLGYASSKDGIHFDERLDQPVYLPRIPYEMKAKEGVSSGCEDPRFTLLEELQSPLVSEKTKNSTSRVGSGERLYMTYTAYNGVNPPMIALTSIALVDFVKHKWDWEEPVLISKEGEDDKDGVILPVKIKGKYALIHRVNHRIVVDYSPTLNFYNRNSFENRVVLEPRPGMWDSRKVGVAMTPIRTNKGWLMLYHGIGDDGWYRVGAALLSLNDPGKVLARSPFPIFQAETPYEKNGVVNNVVFPCGAVIRNGILFVYYGGGDKVVGVATIKLKDLL